MKHCLPHGYEVQTLAALSQHERRIGFQNWVEYTRTASSALTSEIIAKENLICPLLWCRTSFEDIPSTLQHISSCSWLSDGWYWCPSCCRPELFIEYEFTHSSPARQNEPEEEKSVRRAVVFFKDFSRNDIRAHSPDISQVNTPNLRPFVTAYTRRSSDEHHLLVGRTQDKDHNASEPPRIEGNPKSHAYIADLCDVLRALGEEWIRRLVLGTNVPQILPEQYATSLFELGIRALRNYFRGATPSSFQDIFALMHVAVAFSYIVRKDDQALPWDNFLEEAYQWQHLLCDVMEKRAFIKVMNRLCHPQAYSTLSPFKEATVDNDFLPAEQATLVRLIGRLSCNRLDLANQENGDDHQQPSNAANEQFKLLETLPSNLIIKECTDFLDSKAYFHVDIRIDRSDNRW